MNTISAGASATYYWSAAVGSPNSTANLTTANITANTNFCLKSSDLTEAAGVAESGTWDFICLNNVLNNSNQYSASTGYGSNPRGGWEYYASGPNRVGIHAFQYATRESDGAIHKWLRTDLWVDFWGSGSTPCPCSITTTITQPNTFGPVSGSTVGSSPEGAYVFSAKLLSGTNLIYSFGGTSDARNLTNLTPANFNTASSKITLPAGNIYEYVNGVFPVTFSSTGVLPAGLTAGQIYWIANNDSSAPDSWVIYPNQCSFAGCAGSPVTITNSGSGTITMTPFTSTTAFGGWMGLDTKGRRLWVNAAGSATAAPPILVGHDFPYLSQKSKATPPYITALAGTLLPVSGTGLITYYPNSYYFPYDLNQTGSGNGDNRIGYIDDYGAYTLFNPGDVNAQQRSSVLAASFSLYPFYHYDETTGEPVVLNNGHLKNGTTYPTLGAVQPNSRTYPYNSGSWMGISTAAADVNPFYESYGDWADPSHAPAPMQAPLLKTGEPEWESFLVQEANATIGNLYVTASNLGSGPIYYRVLGASVDNATLAGNNQTRGVAWGTRLLGQANYFLPDTSPVSQYLKDIISDNASYYLAQVPLLPSQVSSLGYYPPDVSITAPAYQPWMDDFLWLSMGMEAWRNEYPAWKTYLTTYLYKSVIGRGDASGGGCLWAAPSREVSPYSGAQVAGIFTNLATTWNVLYTDTNAYDTNPAYGNAPGSFGWPGGSWGGCPGTSLIQDVGNGNGSAPTSLVMDYAGSAAIGTLLGIADANTIYSGIRTYQYGATCTGCGPALNFANWNGAGFSYPEWAFGPLGAAN